jgi:hypothetical protein
MTPAHIAGLPVEEGIRALAPAAATLVYVAMAWLQRR